MSKMNHSEHIHALTLKIDDIFQSSVDSTGLLAEKIAHCLSAHPQPGPEALLETGVKAAIQPIIKLTLDENPYCSGAGVASHIESTASVGEYWVLEWWYKKDNGLKQVSLDLDQSTQQRLDFRTFAWFQTPIAEGKPYIHGPYVDYICNTSLTLTVAVPVRVEGNVLGVAALDILVSRIEEELLPLCANEKVVLTNLEGRIIFSSNPRLRIGELFKGEAQQRAYQNSYAALYWL
jgi:hypothetical protein